MFGKDGFKIITDKYSWLYTPDSVSEYKNALLTKEENKNKKKITIKQQNVIYPIFKKIAEKFNDDVYWKTIFETASIGKFQKGVQFKNNTLIYKNKKKVFNKELDMQDEEACKEEFVLFMQNNLSLMSEKDRMKTKELIDQNGLSNPAIEYNSWSKVNKKPFYRDTIIRNFVDEICKEEKLNSEQKSQLSHIIKVGIMADYFNNTTIIFEDEKISEIKGLCRDSKGIYYIDLDSIKIKSLKNKRSRCNKENEFDENTVKETAYTSGDTQIETNNISTANIKFDKMWDKFVVIRNKRTQKCH